MALPAEEVEHLSRVLRLSVGAPIRVFDGRGHEFHAVVEALTRSDARVRVGQAAPAAPELPVMLTLAQAVLKGDKMDDIVRDAVMMGVVAVQPIVTAHSEVRSEVKRAALDRGRRRERWERIAISSVKQCGRAVVPAILERRSFDEMLQALRSGELPRPALMLVEPTAPGTQGASPNAVAVRELQGQAPAQATMLIGPEGGWSPREVEAAAPLCQLITLGGITLRADAAPTIAMAALLSRWGVL